ncbi:T9SS type A sorting domain-containing protein [Ferruginibacter sp. SUN106]|uniref:T9SS type A sorting domain-containing protein n=1 Tax=Ferruginibacter sp. SUN106 TaxID=2978348 RepID=UPI003D3690A9
MKALFIFFFVLLILAVITATPLHGQCLTAPTASCTNTEPLATDGETLNAGITKWYYGPVTTFNSLRLNGGTLIVCGNLTIDKFYMDSGKIFVQAGGRFVIGSGIGSGLPLKGNSYLYNYGTLEIQRNLSLENGWTTAAKPNVVINATRSATFKMNNQYFVINNANSWFVNKGKAYFHGIITDPQSAVNSVCLGKGSETVMTVLYNKVKNSYFAPEAFACVSVSEFSQLWDTLTTVNPYIHLCLGPTHRTDSSCRPFGCKPSWGTADIFRGCTGCNMIQVLSNNFLSFSATQYPAGNMLYWQMENNNTANSLFYIESSTDGIQFQTIHSLAAGKYTNTIQYSYLAASLSSEIGYYRIRYVDTASKFVTYTPIIKIKSKTSYPIVIYPNPFTDQLWVSLAESYATVTATITNVYGKKISQQQLSYTGNRWQFTLPPHCAAGIYIITVTAGEHTWRQKVLKQ